MKSKELYWSAKFPTSGFQTSKNAPAMKHTDLLFVNSLSLSLSVCRQQNITFFGRRANRYPFSSRDSEICSRHSGAPTSVAPPPKSLSYNESRKLNIPGGVWIGIGI